MMDTPRTMPPTTKPDTLTSYAVDATIYQMITSNTP